MIVNKDDKENGMLEIIAVIHPTTEIRLRDVKVRSHQSDKHWRGIPLFELRFPELFISKSLQYKDVRRNFM